MFEVCGDNRFEIIAKAKEHLLDATNIETSPDEMKVLDSFLFRCWQMGWLKKYELPKKPIKNDANYLICPVCKTDYLIRTRNYCPNCGQAIDWGDN